MKKRLSARLRRISGLPLLISFLLIGIANLLTAPSLLGQVQNRGYQNRGHYGTLGPNGLVGQIESSESSGSSQLLDSSEPSQVNQAVYNVERPGSPRTIAISATASPQPGRAYRFETANFAVLNAPTPELARFFAETAEQSRKDLSILWFGEQMPNWSVQCPIRVKVGPHLGAAGETSFVFNNGEVYGWDMQVQGSVERIADSVLPHEISHTIFASMFRERVPRWIDEGAATSIEHESERAKYRQKLLEFVDPRVQRALPFNKMVAILGDYPQDFMPLYSQGNSVAEFLIAQGGHQRFTSFARSGMKNNDWNTAVRHHYGYNDLSDLQEVWIGWVGRQFPPIGTYEPVLARNNRIISAIPPNTAVLAGNQTLDIPEYRPRYLR